MGLYKVDATYFGEVKVISHKTFDDDRGYFSVPFREDEFAELGLPSKFVQDNHSRSTKNVIRGLHFQLDPPMGKLMRVTRGMAYMVAVDIRKDSPTFLRWVGQYASEDNRIQVWAPAGFARGFAAITDRVEVQYKCTGLFDAANDRAIRWNDPDIGIPWPVRRPILSEKDKNAPLVAEYFA